MAVASAAGTYSVVSKRQKRAAKGYAFDDEGGIPPVPTRSQMLENLRRNPVVDIVVVGGGATGCGIALDAVSRYVFSSFRQILVLVYSLMRNSCILT
jgi:hypothetical protein